MNIGNMTIIYEGTTWLKKPGLFMVELAIDDPRGHLNYARVHYKVRTNKFWNTIGWKPSVTHHIKLRGEFDTAEQAIGALMCELRMRAYEKGTKEYAEAYRDRWLPGTEMVDELPDGWRIVEKTLTQPAGTRWACNNKSIFGGEYEHKLVYVGR